MVYCPKSAQSKLERSISLVLIAQLSSELSIKSSGVTLNKPLTSKFRVIFWVINVGGIESSKVTTDVAVLLFPFTSTTVKVTVFSPISAQVKSVWSRANVATEQLSVEPLSISAGVITALPLTSN